VEEEEGGRDIKYCRLAGERARIRIRQLAVLEKKKQRRRVGAKEKENKKKREKVGQKVEVFGKVLKVCPKTVSGRPK